MESENGQRCGDAFLAPLGTANGLIGFLDP